MSCRENRGKAWYTIGEFSEMAGISTRTVDFYTRQGLLQPRQSSRGHGYRHYTDEDRQRITLIKQLQARKLSLQEIRQVLGAGSPHSLKSAAEAMEKVNFDLEKLQTLIQETRSSALAMNQPAMRAVATEALQKATGLCSLLVTLLQDMPLA